MQTSHTNAFVYVFMSVSEISLERPRFLCANPSKLNPLAKPHEDIANAQGKPCKRLPSNMVQLEKRSEHVNNALSMNET